MVSGGYLVCRVGGDGDGIRVHLDAAGAICGVLGELDVALLTPMGAPRVLYEPVLLAILGPVANDQHGVVKVRAA